MTNIISITVKQPLVDKVDTIREKYNLKRSRFISKILKHVCKDETLLQEIFDKEVVKNE